eukprot:jgi/Galph1/1396/GphlegSOOS_G96.1
MYGSGKTLWSTFSSVSLMNKNLLTKWGKVFPGSILEEGLNALCDETIYVYLDLYSFPNEGHSLSMSCMSVFVKMLYQAISLTKSWLKKLFVLFPTYYRVVNKLLQVTKKKYLFVFIDEIGLLGEPKRFHPSSNESPSAVYRMFFGLLSPLARVNRVLCVVAGRSDAIVRQKRMRCHHESNWSF